MADKPVNVLVIGATGNIGSQVISVLKDKYKGVNPIAAVHNNKAEKLGVPSREFDFNNPETVKEALKGIKRVFLLTPPGLEQAKQCNMVVEAAKENGVDFIVRLSGNAVVDENTIIGKNLLAAENVVEQSGLGYTHLRASNFYSNLFNKANFIKTGVLPTAAKKGKVWWIDPSDVGAVAAAILANPDPHKGIAYVLNGPDYYSYNDIARLFEKEIKREVTHVPLTAADYQKELEESFSKFIEHEGTRKLLAQALTELDTIVEKGKYRKVPGNFHVEEIAEKEPKSLETWIHENANAFK
eukprot:TRINITY_DN1477_c0_g1_i1.p1 TRINITY_DN1477_c0_g1~~TRINITY_DN1477_c0_g1_i1.p1  ORF type:complete len:298 (+),score=64.85 TRINITY_DN1477_c0_g1_i1:175-1068(+)